MRSSEPKEQQPRRESSHTTIGAAIDEARAGLTSGTGLNFGISRDTCYHMSNRFAWAWKLADSGIPVVLVYLGFLEAEDMAKDGRLFHSHEEWEHLVRSHSAAVVPDAIWDRRWTVSGQPFILWHHAGGPVRSNKRLGLNSPVGDLAYVRPAQ